VGKRVIMIRHDTEAATPDLDELVDLALAGEEIILTIEGRDAAKLAPIHSASVPSPSSD